MPRNFNLKSFKTVAFSLFAFAMLFSSDIVCGQQPNPYVGIVIYIRAGNENSSVTRTCSVYTASSGNPLITSKHNLPNNPRYLVHVAPGSLTYPDSAWVYHPHPIGFKEYTDVPALVDARWEHEKYNLCTSGQCTGSPSAMCNGYHRDGTADPSKNCHGYSTGKNVWLNDFQKLVDDDWTKYFYTTNLPDLGGAVYGNDTNPDHSIKIDGVTSKIVNLCDLLYTVKISEKHRDSAIYKSAFAKTVVGQSSGEVQLNMKNFAGGIDIWGFFYKKN